MSAGPPRAFEDVVRAHTGADFVERAWLQDEIERALEPEEGRYVLVTGAPGAGKAGLLAGIARARPDRLRCFFRRDSRNASRSPSGGTALTRARPELTLRALGRDGEADEVPGGTPDFLPPP
ncbi:hypothetical protein ACIRBZ_11815 [Streptomyces sp. NPDC094038]|uniref:hypothetical protein n=1 Tax=Streptomyces sp. NPDC094038 TaxID=3366055 RepID=UPI0038250EB6